MKRHVLIFGVVGGLLIVILQHFIGPAPAISIAGMTMLVTLIGEVWCGLWLLGQRFEKLDLSSELRP